MNILVLNGPNMCSIGTREPEVYGTRTLDELMAELSEYALGKGVEIDILTSNHEGVLIDALHEARETYDGVIINPGALAHYSYALRDAIACLNIPVIEVHLTDTAMREDFRRVSVTALVCDAQFAGGGIESYLLGIDELVRQARAKKE